MEFKIVHPSKAYGAQMRVLIPGKPELAFQEGYETVTVGEDYLPVSIGISYPCPKHFSLSSGILGFGDLECLHEDKEHGRVIVSCDDGMALMPHVIRTKADISHFIDDLIKSRHFECYFGSDKKWEETLRYILTNDPIYLSLPDGPRSYCDEYDMSKVCYWV